MQNSDVRVSISWADSGSDVTSRPATGNFHRLDVDVVGGSYRRRPPASRGRRRLLKPRRGMPLPASCSAFCNLKGANRSRHNDRMMSEFA